jgi:mannose-6-phosphate isomerase-like protein (cupin superfamily)
MARDPARPGTPVDTARYRGQFFAVLQQSARSPTAVMTIGPGADAGPEETHAGDQVVYVIEGEALRSVDGAQHRVAAGGAVLIPAGARHQVANPGRRPLCVFTVYASPAY